MNSIPFSFHQIAALRTLSALWPDKDWCLIGASALACHLDMRWRQTADLDLLLDVDLDVFPAGLEKQVGWTRHPTKDHEWQGPGQVRVDVLPAGIDVLSEGQIIWNSGHRMSLLGARLAMEHAATLTLASDLSVRVAPLHIIALLKVASYLDRPYERVRDLEDLGYILEEYVSADDLRRFTDEVPQDVEYECRPAFLLGFDLGRLLNEQEWAAVRRFIAISRGFGADTTRSRLRQRGPARWRVGNADSEARIDGVLDALETGLSSTLRSRQLR